MFFFWSFFFRGWGHVRAAQRPTRGACPGEQGPEPKPPPRHRGSTGGGGARGEGGRGAPEKKTEICGYRIAGEKVLAREKVMPTTTMEFMDFVGVHPGAIFSRTPDHYGADLPLAELQGVGERHASRSLRQREQQTDTVRQLRARVRRQCSSCPQPLQQVPVLPGHFAQVGARASAAQAIYSTKAEAKLFTAAYWWISSTHPAFEIR